MDDKKQRLCWDTKCVLGKPICCIDCDDNTVCSESCSEPNYCGWIELDENISMVEARNLMKAVTTLARGCAFTKRELLQIVAVCNTCVDRLEDEDKQEGVSND